VRLKLDENRPAELADDLAALGHDVDSVHGEGLAGAPDTRVAAASRAVTAFS
jgi:predicted nuclease of predicted toxin-antitoxin system